MFSLEKIQNSMLDVIFFEENMKICKEKMHKTIELKHNFVRYLMQDELNIE